ncbi:hypothetical protein AYO20_04747 [Fonsecaea nubica]|uniref:Uncharacterized protein n=1 Tax=Fonsecaea nubica TaxID=856822 RepID=A0A178D4Q7_9EURO|nr:hypothetical protein AYO20_04747 [Fonsecaea nubica]OAL36085.1 hypothetical protein AYO20_04747 [Fonsecaea nubica]
MRRPLTNTLLARMTSLNPHKISSEQNPVAALEIKEVQEGVKQIVFANLHWLEYADRNNVFKALMATDQPPEEEIQSFPKGWDQKILQIQLGRAPVTESSDP